MRRSPLFPSLPLLAALCLSALAAPARLSAQDTTQREMERAWRMEGVPQPTQTPHVSGLPVGGMSAQDIADALQASITQLRQAVSIANAPIGLASATEQVIRELEALKGRLQAAADAERQGQQPVFEQPSQLPPGEGRPPRDPS